MPAALYSQIQGLGVISTWKYFSSITKRKYYDQYSEHRFRRPEARHPGKSATADAESSEAGRQAERATEVAFRSCCVGGPVTRRAFFVDHDAGVVRGGRRYRRRSRAVKP
jgi:hypothetical protein